MYSALFIHPGLPESLLIQDNLDLDPIYWSHILGEFWISLGSNVDKFK